MLSMRRLPACMLLCFGLLALSGCSVFCAVEQWKCDAFGCCGFGTRPRYAPFPGPVPGSGYGAPGPGVTYGTPTMLPPASPAPTWSPSNGPVVPAF